MVTHIVLWNYIDSGKICMGTICGKVAGYSTAYLCDGADTDRMGTVLQPVTWLCPEVCRRDVWNRCQRACGQAGLVLSALQLADLSDGSAGILFHWIQTDEKYSEGSSKQSWKIYNDRCDVSGHVCTFAGISGDTVI